MDYIVDTWIGKIKDRYDFLHDQISGFSGTVSGSYSWDNPCKSCGGSGGVSCSTCGGGGQVSNGTESVSCSTCGGDGTANCSECGGDGIVVSTAEWNENLGDYGGGIPNYHICTGGDNHGNAPHYNSYTEGWFIGWDQDRGVQLNGHDPDELVSNLFQIVDGTFTGELDNGRTNIGTINAEINSIRTNLNSYIAKAINQAMTVITNPDYTYCIDGVWKGNSLPSASYITDLRNEATFLSYSGHTADFGKGAGVWWNDTTNNDGIKREYVQGRALSARFRYWASLWARNPYTGTCHFMEFTIPQTEDEAIVPTPEIGKYAAMVAACPVQIKQDFWGKAGSIIVSAKRRLVNPFQFFDSTGFYGAFNGTGRDMWAVSASRAGINLGRGYEIQWPGNDRGLWNLCNEDWDAVMLPVARAWNNTSTRAWGSESIDNTTTSLLNKARTTLGVNTSYTTPVPSSSYNPFNPGAAKK
jgi:hypothetical protein